MTESPVTEPSATEPSATVPPATEPPATVPPATAIKRPLMRPISRPQPPSPPPIAAAPAKTVVAPSLSPVRSDSATSSSLAAVQTEPASDAQTPSRHQPIPPPSEPKQYRAIGLVRGRYTPSEEQFTRGQMVTTDGTGFEAVLLGRVMSLVKNHLDLAQDHLWVVYPRTRDAQEDLHVQIVGVWEPEKLRKLDAEESGELETAHASDDESASQFGLSSQDSESPAEEDLSPGYEDDYFSIRGEVVFVAPETESVVVKIHQAPRKSSDKAKAFKLQLKGVLPGEKSLGYFWDLQVKRQATALVISNATSVGLIPPRKKPAGAPRGDRKTFRKRPEGRSGPPKGGKPTSGSSGSAVPMPRREAIPKPSKRTDPKPDA